MLGVVEVVIWVTVVVVRASGTVADGTVELAAVTDDVVACVVLVAAVDEVRPLVSSVAEQDPAMSVSSATTQIKRILTSVISWSVSHHLPQGATHIRHYAAGSYVPIWAAWICGSLSG